MIKVFPNASSNNGVVFKDLSPRVFNFWDRGLLGLTVDPRLGNGTGHDFVYVLYAKDAPPGQNPPRLERRLPDAARRAHRRLRRQRHALAHPGERERHRGRRADPDRQRVVPAVHDATRSVTSRSVPTATSTSPAATARATRTPTGASSAAASRGTPTPKNPCGDPPGRHRASRTRRRPGAAARCARRARADRPASRACSAARCCASTRTPAAGVPGQPAVQRVGAVVERVAHPRLRDAQPVPVHDAPGHDRDLGRRRRLGDLRGDQPDPDPDPDEGAELRLALRREADAPLRLPRPRHVQGALQRHGRSRRPTRTSRTSTASPVNANDTCGVQRTARRSPASRSTPAPATRRATRTRCSSPTTRATASTS